MVNCRPLPRISINKLGEYLTATPARRKTIIRDQKYPPDYQTSRYTDAGRAITAFICSGWDKQVLETERARIANTIPQSRHDAQRIELCLEATKRILAVSGEIDLRGTTVKPGIPHPPTLELAGVTVSVRPEVLVTTPTTAKGLKIGLVKLYFAKTHPLTEQSGEYITALLQHFAEEHLSSLGSSDRGHIHVIDVFAGQVFTAPRAKVRRLTDAHAACEEIATRWPSL